MKNSAFIDILVNSLFTNKDKILNNLLLTLYETRNFLINSKNEYNTYVNHNTTINNSSIKNSRKSLKKSQEKYINTTENLDRSLCSLIFLKQRKILYEIIIFFYLHKIYNTKQEIFPLSSQVEELNGGGNGKYVNLFQCLYFNYYL